MRGVYMDQATFDTVNAGSSPHTRGLLGLRVIRPQHHRIIPAHAGFTTEILENQPKTTDHPRTRGVYPSLAAGEWSRQGSSPHTRGLLAVYDYAVCDAGIIPAHAGFTFSQRPGRR